jgi:hypothetical protein
LDSSRLQTIKKKVEFTPFFLVHAFLTAKNKMGDVDQEVSGAGELPPCAFSEPDLNLSAHPAPIIQP